MYAHNISIVLNISTDLVSPQYHVRFDEFFEITCDSKRDITTPFTWQQLNALIRFNGDNPLEMHDVVHQVHEGYVLDVAVNMVCKIQDEPQIIDYYICSIRS